MSQQTGIKPFVKDFRNSMKWFEHGQQDVIDLTLAEMDFGLYKPFQEQLTTYLRQVKVSIETLSPQKIVEESTSFILNWYKKYHHAKIPKKQQILFFSSVSTLCSCAILATSQANESIMIFSPVYSYYQAAIKILGRKVIPFQLQFSQNQFTINWQSFQKQIKLCRMIILSHPHNPSGRVWSQKQLQNIVYYCKLYKVVILSDQILSDMALVSHKRTFHTILKFGYQNIIMANSLSKSFNSSSLQTGYCIIFQPTLLTKISFQLQKYYGDCSKPNFLASCYYKICLNETGYSWLKQINQIFEINYKNLKLMQETHLGQLIIGELDSGYLVYLDFRNYANFINLKQLKDLFKRNQIYVSFMDSYYDPPKETYAVRIAISVEPSIFKKFLSILPKILNSSKPSL